MKCKQFWNLDYPRIMTKLSKSRLCSKHTPRHATRLQVSGCSILKVVVYGKQINHPIACQMQFVRLNYFLSLRSFLHRLLVLLIPLKNCHSVIIWCVFHMPTKAIDNAWWHTAITKWFTSNKSDDADVIYKQ